MGEFVIEHRRQRFGVALGDRKNDGLADQGFAENAILVGVALVHDLAKFAHDSLIACRNREFAFQRVGIDFNVRLRLFQIRGGGECVFELLVCSGIQAVPLNVLAKYLDDAVGARGLDGPGFVNLVADQIAVVDGTLECVGKRRFIPTEKAQGVTNESRFIVRRAVVIGRLDAGCCGQTCLLYTSDAADE